MNSTILKMFGLAFFLLVLCGRFQLLSAQEDSNREELTQSELMEILKTAPPAPNPMPERSFTSDESSQTEQLRIEEYDPASEVKTIFNRDWSPGSYAPEKNDPPFKPGNSPQSYDPLDYTEYPTSSEREDGMANFAKRITPTQPTPLLDATTYPWCTIYKILMRFYVGGYNYYYSCSAESAGSFHLLTAGHCIYNWDPNGDGNTSDRSWASEIWAWGGQGDSVNPTGSADWPFGVAKAVYLRSYTGWTTYGNLDHDWGVITLNRRDGDHTGWMGRESTTTNALNYSGYPAEMPYVPSDNLLQYGGFDENNVDRYSTYRIFLDAYIYGGHSGGPSWRYSGSERYIQGIHSTSNRVGLAIDTRLTDTKRSDVNSFMATDETVRPPTARPDLTEYFFEGNSAKDLLTNDVTTGADIQVEYNVLNSGFATSNNFTVSFYLSSDAYVNTFDHYIGAETHSLDAYSYLNQTTTLTIPHSVPGGIYYVGWLVSGGETEYSTSNNSVVIGSEMLSVMSNVSYVDSDGICNGNTPCYSDIQDAIEATPDWSVIMVADDTFSENINLNTQKTITISGGWDSTFSNQTSKTAINGSMTFGKGTTNVDGIILSGA